LHRGDFVPSIYEGWGFASNDCNDPLGRFAKLGSFLEDKKYTWNISVSNLCYSEPVVRARLFALDKNGPQLFPTHSFKSRNQD
jgi:hypothetical protein